MAKPATSLRVDCERHVHYSGPLYHTQIIDMDLRLLALLEIIKLTAKIALKIVANQHTFPDFNSHHV